MAKVSSAALPNGIKGAMPWYALALVVVLLDQYTKTLASTALDYGVPRQVFSWFNLTLQHNSGAAFSFLSDAGGWQRYFFSAVAALISTLLMVWLYRMPRSTYLLALSLGLILGGAIGNLWDRIALGYVVDFISVHWDNRYYFPAFNIADAAITGGAIGMLWDSFSGSHNSDEETGETA
jgi:signal peptidase II